jgi:GTP-binding protein
MDAENDLMIRDLDKLGESVIVARGGEGGKGNSKFKASTPGEAGEERTLILELKLVADAGIIGFPNAGKSTLVSSISGLKTKAAAYPFTTKSPLLGVVTFEDESYVVADMPGLIEGAHSGKGLGDRFLRHIERTRVLVHLVDIVPLDGSDPVENYEKLERELELYSEEVFSKPRIVVASKMDIEGSSEAYERFKSTVKKNVIAISSVKKEGLEDLKEAIYREIEDVKD